MINYLRLAIAMLFLLSTTTACAHEEAHEAEPIKAAEWPTPVEATPLPTATPFPKINTNALKPKATLAPAPTTALTATTATTSTLSPAVMQVIVTQLGMAKVAEIMQQVAAGATPGEVLTQLDPTDLQAILKQLPQTEVQTMVDSLEPSEKELLMAQLSSRVSGLPLVATGVILGDKVPTYSRASASSSPLDTRLGGDIVGILGRNQTGEWIYVFNTKANYGWVSAASIRILGDTTKIPVLPDNTAQPSINSLLGVKPTTTTTKTTASTSPTQTTKSTAPALATMPAVTTATFDKPLSLQQGPGSAYGLMTTVAQTETVEVLAYNRSKEWLLVRTASGQYGWTLPSALKLAGSVEAAPVVVSARPSADIKPGQLAPISGMSMQTTPATSPTPATSAAPETVAPAAATDAMIYTVDGQPVNTASLGQVATAKLKASDLVLRLGPADTYGELTKLTDIEEVFYLLSVDSTRQWGLVQRTSWNKPEYGWLALSNLNFISGEVAQAPQIVTTWTMGNGIEVRNGPGLTHAVVGTLGDQTLVQVHGLSKDRNWALVRPVFGGNMVWLSRRFMANTPTDALANVPEVTMPATGVNEQAAANTVFNPVSLTPKGTFVFQRVSGGDIMVMQADGSGLRRLTTGIDPVLAPNGQQVAFTRWEGNIGSLWVINLDGSGERQIVGNMTKAKGAEWSPDGSQIILNYETEYKTEREICASLAGGRSPRPPRDGKDIEVKIRDRRPFLCWTAPPSAQWGLRVINVADGTPVDRDGGTFPFRPTWNPVQPWRVVYDSGNGLAELDVTQNSNRALTDIVDEGSPVYAPDGSALVTAIANNGGGSGYDIYRLDGNGQGRVRLTQTPLWATTGPDMTQSWNNVAPTWSPDGQLIAFLTDRNGDWELWVMNRDGSNQRPLVGPEVMAQLKIEYHFVDERVMSWR